MKKDYWQSFLICFICIITDQSLKYIFSNSNSVRYNEGFILGSFSDLPVSIRILTMSSLYGFIFFLFSCLIYFLSPHVKKLKFALAILVGGIGGNVWDRTFYGKTLDFIPLKFSQQWYFTFNTADLFQWIGALSILWFLLVHGPKVWPDEDQRGQYVVNPKEQIRFALKMSVIAMCSCLILGIFSFAYWRMFLNDIGQLNSHFLSNYILVFISLSFLFTIIAFLTGLFLSHKSVGPLYAFEIYIEDLLNGRDRPLNLREGDHYKHLEKIANDLRRALKK